MNVEIWWKKYLSAVAFFKVKGWKTFSLSNSLSPTSKVSSSVRAILANLIYLEVWQKNRKIWSFKSFLKKSEKFLNHNFENITHKNDLDVIYG